jgi:alkyl sulfatase BDS1-like metallo-beta-lactamase superfamily hydrolase
LGWYDGNPAHLWPHPPVEAGKRYVGAMGGVEAAIRLANEAFDDGDYRWAAEVLDRILFADEHNAKARELQARTFEQLAYGAENGTWRNAFLAGAHELRHGVFGTPITTAGLLSALTVEQIFASLAIRIDGPAAWDEHLTVAWRFTDLDMTYFTELRNGTLIHRQINAPADAETTLRLTRPLFLGLVTQQIDLKQALSDDTVQMQGDPAALQRLLAVLAPVDPAFPIVTP